MTDITTTEIDEAITLATTARHACRDRETLLDCIDSGPARARSEKIHTKWKASRARRLFIAAFVACLQHAGADQRRNPADAPTPAEQPHASQIDSGSRYCAILNWTDRDGTRPGAVTDMLSAAGAALSRWRDDAPAPTC